MNMPFQVYPTKDKHNIILEGFANLCHYFFLNHSFFKNQIKQVERLHDTIK